MWLRLRRRFLAPTVFFRAVYILESKLEFVLGGSKDRGTIRHVLHDTPKTFLCHFQALKGACGCAVGIFTEEVLNFPSGLAGIPQPGPKGFDLRRVSSLVQRNLQFLGRLLQRFKLFLHPSILFRLHAAEMDHHLPRLELGRLTS